MPWLTDAHMAKVIRNPFCWTRFVFISISLSLVLGFFILDSFYTATDKLVSKGASSHCSQTRFTYTKLWSDSIWFWYELIHCIHWKNIELTLIRLLLITSCLFPSLSVSLFLSSSRLCIVKVIQKFFNSNCFSDCWCRCARIDFSTAIPCASWFIILLPVFFLAHRMVERIKPMDWRDYVVSVHTYWNGSRQTC